MKAKLAGILFFCLANCLVCVSQPGVTFPMAGQAFFYHPLSKSLLLIGGSAAIPDSINSDIWKWDGKDWTKIAAKGPGSRSFFMGALDTKTGELNFYGGMGFIEIPKGDMWTFDGETWESVKINSIGTHDHHNMVYMDHLDAFLVYGGNINGYPNFDSTTWILKNGKFSGLKIPGPGPRWHYGMVYDRYRKKVILYGGGEKPGEQWEFDGIKWTKIITTVNPGKRFYHAMAYNEDTKTIILHGGWHNQDPRDSTNLTPRSTWEWNGLSWKKIAEEPIFTQAMAYYPERKSIIAFGTTGKYNESNIAMWELKKKWSKLFDYGKWTTLDILKKHIEQNPNDMLVLVKYAAILQKVF